MKKWVLLLLVVLLFTGCGSSEKEKKTAETPLVTKIPEETEKSSSEENDSRFTGTYVGIHGSSLIVYDDHTADYYWKQFKEVEEGDSWDFRDNKLYVSSKKIGYDMFAEIPEGEVSSVLFKADDPAWLDENFIRVSPEAKHLTTEEHIALIEDTLKTSIDTPVAGLPVSVVPTGFDPATNKNVTVGGLTFSVPAYYEEQGHTEEVAEFIFEQANSGAHLQIHSYTMDMSDLDRSKKMELLSTISEGLTKVLANPSTGDSFSSTGEEILRDDSVFLKKTSFHGTVSGFPADAILYSYLDNEHLVMPLIIYTSDTPGLGDDFDAMVLYFAENHTASAEPAAPENKTAASSPASGIRPEVRELLDSYEAFMDEYVAFMESYDASDISMLSKYLEFMQKYTDFAEKVEALDDTELTDEEALYYAEVNMRVSQKLLRIAGSMGN